MTTFKRFEDIEAWQLARELSKQIFEESTRDTFAKDFKLRDQVNDASGSVMDNIAEGFGRGGNREFINFLTYSIGSCNEVKSQLYRILDRNYISNQKFKDYYRKADEIIKKLGALVHYLNGTKIRGVKFTNLREMRLQKVQQNK